MPRGRIGGGTYAAMSRDGQWIAVSSYDAHGYRITIRDSNNGEIVSIIKSKDWLRDMCFSPDGSALITEDIYRLRVWSIPDGELIGVLPGQGLGRFRYERGLLPSCFSPDGSLLLTAAEDGSLSVWDNPPTPGRVVWSGKSVPVTTWVNAEQERSFVVLNNEDSGAKMHDLSTGLEAVKLEMPTELAVGAISADGRMLVGAKNSVVYAWDLTAGARLASQAVDNPISSVTFTASDQQLLLAMDSAEETVICIWDPKTGALEKKLRIQAPSFRTTLAGQAGRVVAITAEGMILYSSNGQMVANIDRGRRAKPTSKIIDQWGPVALFSPTQEMFVHNVRDRKLSFNETKQQVIQLRRSTDGKIIHTINLKKCGAIVNMRWSWDSKQIAVISQRHQLGPGLLMLFDVESGERLWATPCARFWLAELDFSPDGDRLVTCLYDDGGKIATDIWQSSTGANLLTLQDVGIGEFMQFNAPARFFSHDGKSLLVRFGSNETPGILRSLQ